MDDKLDLLKNQSIDIAHDLLTWLQATASDTTQLIKGEVPKFVEEFIGWTVLENSIYASLFLILSILLLFIIYKSWKIFIKLKCDEVIPIPVLITIICLTGSVLLACLSVDHTCTALKARYYPRVFLSEWVLKQVQK